MTDTYSSYVTWVRAHSFLWEFDFADDTKNPTPEHLFATHARIQDALSSQPRYIHSQARIHPSAQIEGNVVIEDGAQILANTLVFGPSFIGRNAVVGNFSVLRGGCFLAHEALVGNHCYCNEAVIGRSARVAHFVELSRSLVSFNSSVSAFAITATVRADKSPVPSRDRRTDHLKAGCVVGSNTFLAPYVLLLPGVAVGNRCFVGSFSVVSRDIPDDTHIESTRLRTSRANTIMIPRRQKVGDFLRAQTTKAERDYAGVLLVDREERFVLQRRGRSVGTHNPGKISTFGGRLRSEESAVEGAVRELSEETGLFVKEGELEPLIETVFLRDDGTATHCSLFLLGNIDPEGLTVTEGSGYELIPQVEAVSHEDLTELCRTAIAAYWKRPD